MGGKPPLMGPDRRHIFPDGVGVGGGGTSLPDGNQGWVLLMGPEGHTSPVGT